MVKKLVKYYFKRQLVWEIVSIIFILLYISICIMSVFIEEKMPITSVTGLYYFAFFNPVSTVANIQDRYFISSLPMSNEEYFKANRIKSTISTFKITIVIVFGYIGFGVFKETLNLLNENDWYLFVLSSLSVLIMSILITKLIALDSQILNIPVDMKSNPNAVRSKKHATFNIIGYLIIIAGTVFVSFGSFISSIDNSTYILIAISLFISLIAIIMIHFNQIAYQKRQKYMEII